jgi:hypothetical protein
MAKIPDHFCPCCQAEWYSNQISDRNYEAGVWRCPACGEWESMESTDAAGPSSDGLILSERDRNLLIAALQFFWLRFPGSAQSKQLLGICALAAAGYGLPTEEEIKDLCERINPACVV